MHSEPTAIKRALISVSDKTGIVELARTLDELGVQILSTGGTATLLQDNQISVTSVESYTHAPEMMGGRVKTLHPLIAGGILGLRDHHEQEAALHQIGWIDLVVCNLYPFEKTVNDGSSGLDEAVENIDIGGPTMVRSAAKNFAWVTVLTDTADYATVLGQLTQHGTVSFELRKKLAAKAFAHTAAYDSIIHEYLHEELFPQRMTRSYTLHTDIRDRIDEEERLLRYGENPHQKAAVYRATVLPGKADPFSILDCAVLQGKQLSFNNLGDAYGALDTVREFSMPACVVVKHATPCGVAVNASPKKALERALHADKTSAFGGIIALNRTCDKAMAEILKNHFFEVLTAPAYTEEALAILRKKRQLRVLETGKLPPLTGHLVGRALGNDLLLQQKDHAEVTAETLRTVTDRKPTAEEIADMLFAWKVVKHVKSNAIVTASDRTTCGIGGGQVSRIDATQIALAKSGESKHMVLASDAFFPFRDSIDALVGSKVTAVVQPGGSVRDQEVIDACNEADIAMVLTGVRSFLHG